MTSTKSEIRRVGRNIRRVTGLTLPISMRMAKIWVRSARSKIELACSPFGGNVAEKTWCHCCGGEYIGIEGPKGIIKFEDIDKKVAKSLLVGPFIPTVRKVKIRIANIDAALKALRDNGFTAAMTDGIRIDANGFLFGSRDFVNVSVNASARRIHETLLLAKLVKPVGSRDRKFLSGLRLELMTV